MWIRGWPRTRTFLVGGLPRGVIVPFDRWSAMCAQRDHSGFDVLVVLQCLEHLPEPTTKKLGVKIKLQAMRKTSSIIHEVAQSVGQAFPIEITKSADP